MGIIFFGEIIKNLHQFVTRIKLFNKKNSFGQEFEGFFPKKKGFKFKNAAFTLTSTYRKTCAFIV